MPTIVTAKRKGCRFADCAAASPVVCFHGDYEIRYTGSNVCIACATCVPECPVKAMVREDDLPDDQAKGIASNAARAPIRVYEGIARNPGFRLFGNVTVGRDAGVDDLRAAYHAVLFCCGAETDRRLGIPGEDLAGSHTATEFVGWYNGHPDYRDRAFDLGQEVAVIIGQGNVAIDVCRILAKTVDELKHTVIAEHALDSLAASRIREIHLIGRRGPAQAKFTTK